MKKISRAFIGVMIMLFTTVFALVTFISVSGADAAVVKKVIKARPGGTTQQAKAKKTAPIFAGGSGTLKKPYIVRTPAQFVAFAQSVNNGNAYGGKYIKLAGDIDLANVMWVPIGFFNKNGIRAFKGNFDGAGFTIWNLTTGASGRSAVGLFGAAEGATLKGINLTYVTVVGDSNVGGIVAYMKNTSLKDCSVFGTIEGKSTVGGVVGSALAGILQNCTFSGTVLGENGSSIGGLAGAVDQTLIRSVQIEGQVEGESEVGGLVGSFLAGSIRTSTTKSLTVKGSRNVGGLVGHFIDQGEIIDSLFNGQVVGEENVGGLVGRTMGGTFAKNVAEGSVQGENNIGGLIGELEDGLLRNGTAKTSVTGVNHVGGLVGLLSGGRIENSNNVSGVKGGEAVGGLIGKRTGGELVGGSVSGGVSAPFKAGSRIGEDTKNP